MRVSVLARDVLPGDQVWFPNTRKPQVVEQVEDRQGAERLAVLYGASGVIWHLFYDNGMVYKYEPDPVVEEEPEFLDPEGNPV